VTEGAKKWPGWADDSGANTASQLAWSFCAFFQWLGGSPHDTGNRT
jgi:hypothetical protein